MLFIPPSRSAFSLLYSKRYPFNVFNFGKNQKSQGAMSRVGRLVNDEFHVSPINIGSGAMNVLEHCHDATASISPYRGLVFCAELHHGVGGELVDSTLSSLSYRCVFVMHNSMDIKEHSITLILLAPVALFSA